MKINQNHYSSIILPLFLIIFSGIIISGCNAQDKIPPTSTPQKQGVDVNKNIDYSNGEFEEQTLDLYLPIGIEGPFPIILMIHQGNGNKEQLTSWGHALARSGYASISINHRQWPDYSYPDHQQDAFCALAWIYDNSNTYSFDTGNIFALGQSAGGSLAAMLGVIDQPEQFTDNCPNSVPDDGGVQGVITFTGIFDYPLAFKEAPDLADYLNELLGGNQMEVPDIWQDASAISWVNGNEPPFLIIHGEDDHSIPPGQSISFADLLENSGVSVELILVPGAGHNQIISLAQSQEPVLNFLNTWIKK